MQITETANEGLKRGYEISISAAQINDKISVRFDELKKTIRVPGFRVGKVPTKVLSQRYGKTMWQEVVEQLVQETSKKILEDGVFRPSLSPNILVDKMSEDEGVVYRMDFETLPEVTLMDYDALSLEHWVVDVKQEVLDEQLKALAEQQKAFTKVDRKAELGDAVVMDFVGSIDDVEFQGGKGSDYQLVLGSGSFIPGFEEQLVGSVAGADLDVKVTFPEQYNAQELAGKEALFKCTIKEVKEGEVPVLDDAFAQTLGLENLSGLEDAVRQQVVSQYDTLSRDVMKRKLLDILVEGHQFALPGNLVEVEFNAIWEKVQARMKEAGQDYDSFGKTEELVREDFKKIAIRRVCLGLVVSEIARVQDIQVSNEELSRGVYERTKDLPESQRKEFFDYLVKNPQAQESFRAPIIEEKVINYLFERIKLVDQPIGLDELIKLSQEQEEKNDGGVVSEALESDEAKDADKKKETPKKKAAPKKKAESKSEEKKEDKPAPKKKKAAKKDTSPDELPKSPSKSEKTVKKAKTTAIKD